MPRFPGSKWLLPVLIPWLIAGCAIRLTKRNPLINYVSYRTPVIFENSYQYPVMFRLSGVIECELTQGGGRDCEFQLRANEERTGFINWRAKIIKDSSGRVIRIDTPTLTVIAESLDNRRQRRFTPIRWIWLRPPSEMPMIKITVTSQDF